jgi:hypothetical protein
VAQTSPTCAWSSSKAAGLPQQFGHRWITETAIKIRAVEPVLPPMSYRKRVLTDVYVGPPQGQPLPDEEPPRLQQRTAKFLSCSWDNDGRGAASQNGSTDEHRSWTVEEDRRRVVLTTGVSERAEFSDDASYFAERTPSAEVKKIN